jgi:hypothetical protein
MRRRGLGNLQLPRVPHRDILGNLQSLEVKRVVLFEAVGEQPFQGLDLLRKVAVLKLNVGGPALQV